MPPLYTLPKKKIGEETHKKLIITATQSTKITPSQIKTKEKYTYQQEKVSTSK